MRTREEPNPEPKRFKKPTLKELETYKQEANLNLVDCSTFYDFYESKGWAVGKAPMKDWRASMRNWQRTEAERIAKRGAPPTARAKGRETADAGYDDLARYGFRSSDAIECEILEQGADYGDR